MFRNGSYWYKRPNRLLSYTEREVTSCKNIYMNIDKYKHALTIYSAAESIREALLIFVNTGIALYMQGLVVLHASAACVDNRLYVFYCG